MNVLRIDDLRVALDGGPVLRGVSMALAAGQIHALVGESGSGKSMTAFATMGLLPAGAVASGHIALDGQALLGLDDAALCRLRGAAMGIVFQEPMTALNPLHPIGRQVAETIHLHSHVSRPEALARAAEALRRAGLPPERHPLTRYPHELSGGQRQRAVIAMAIAMRPKLLIADEPTTALDVTTQAGILALLRGLADEAGLGVLLITHDLAVVAAVADSISVMRDGVIVESGEAAALLSDPYHPYTAALRDAALPGPKPVARQVQGEPLVLEVSDLVREYRPPRPPWARARPGVRAVDGVSFAVRRGEILGLVGESGCGKSTLSRAILGLDAAQRGTIRVNGEDLAGADKAARRRFRRAIQVVFQDPYGSFNPRHRVERIVAEPFNLLDDNPGAAARRARVEEMLEAVGLPRAAADKYPHQFSGGQRQRIAIARALIIDPALVILDEAVSALDVSIRAEILALLGRLAAQRDTAYLFIAHDLAVVRALCHRVLVMQAGRIVEEAPTDRLFRAPQHGYTRQLLAASPDLGAALRLRSVADGRGSTRRGGDGVHAMVGESALTAAACVRFDHRAHRGKIITRLGGALHDFFHAKGTGLGL